MAENSIIVQKGFNILHPLLAGYIVQEMKREYQNNWWSKVLETLSDQSRELPDHGEDIEPQNALGMANCLRLFDCQWNDLFRRKLSINLRTWAKELMGVRNKLTHLGGKDYSPDDTWRALDTMSRLSEPIAPEASESIRSLLREARYGSADGSTSGVECDVHHRPPKNRGNSERWKAGTSELA